MPVLLEKGYVGIYKIYMEGRERMSGAAARTGILRIIRKI